MENAAAAKQKLGMLSGHMVWCALVALALARRDGSVLSPAQENLFLTLWLATAQKQRRFPREVATDISWLLKQGRRLGVNAKLVSKLTYLWESCTGELKAQTDLFRLTHAIETARDMHWLCRMLSDREWSGRHAVTLNAGVNAVYLPLSNLDAAFDEDGHQVKVLMANITGSVAGLGELLDRSGWRLEHQSDLRYHLWACREASGPASLC
ncbi:DUF2913 family protein [Yokenella regensburgei]|uniref:Protein of uncharacterized function (DUF2913) n=1 Tax=Yokenella regensburgei TaxID=158877 RepID=A0AB38FWE9_9ENTR|nr:DUF2913 family protein [Yokenella regensburgei]KFD24837.1 hypothetical protein GYRE_00811 [Yokenella regensburgei ATCC 49455]SQA62948.1 Protein of uncharacterised function (DUF2913) [Yokenella regensburgei]SQB02191.1 Protein of uncharacterised function (DUF2913) [Yokenella regensburgei]SUQ07507.1 Protein of uncharacterised function (DUF2913) [Yokenella regensburgei]